MTTTTNSAPRFAIALAMSLALCVSSRLDAQTVVPAHSLRGRLADYQARLNSLQGIPAGSAAAEQIDMLAELLTLQVATAPLGTSTGAYTYSFDVSRGTFIRSSQGFGPSFAKRTLTSGRGTLSVGFNWLHARYNALNGFDVRNGDLRLAINGERAPALALPFGYSSARLNAASDTAVVFVNYGVTDKLDVSLAIPWVRVALDLDVGLFTPSNLDVTPGGHASVLPRIADTGLCDVALIGKYRLWENDRDGIAAEAEVRLPSGSRNGLRGAGVTRSLASVIYSRAGQISPHVNVGYEFWSSAVPLTRRGDVYARNQVAYGFGLEIQAHARATVIVDIVGRRQLNGGQVDYRTVPIGTGTLDVLVPVARGIDVISAAPGFKWNVAGNVLLTGNVLMATTNDGLRANVIPVVGFDWAF